MHKKDIMILFVLFSLIAISVLSLNTYFYFNTNKMNNNQFNCFQAQYSSQQAELKKVQCNLDRMQANLNNLGNQINNDIKSTIVVQKLAQNLLREQSEALIKNNGQDKLAQTISNRMEELDKKEKSINRLKREIETYSKN